MKLVVTLFFTLFISPLVLAQVEFHQHTNDLNITVNSRHFASYVFQDPNIHRPYFHSLKTYKGEPITRNHPPIKGKDLTDHAEYHPGLWMAFGDISGHDYWRNKSRVKHVRFLKPPQSGEEEGSFTVLNHYFNKNHVICREECSIRIAPDREGIFLFWDSVFYSKTQPFFFGDQEEMGLGIRMATPLIAKNGGTILNRQGHRNEEEVWGKQSPWCAYYGENKEGETVGALLMTAPDNFRSSWFHARDYGLLTANPFGRKAFTNQEKSRVPIKKGERFPLRFGVYLFQTKTIDPDFLASKYKTFIAGRIKQ